MFPRFDEDIAFEIGSALRARGAEEGWPVVIEVRLWDRLLFHAALPGSAEGAVLAGRLERMYRSSLVMTFGGGTNEIQRDIIGMVGLGLPAAARR